MVLFETQTRPPGGVVANISHPSWIRFPRTSAALARLRSRRMGRNTLPNLLRRLDYMVV
jgi:hypothetical protein